MNRKYFGYLVGLAAFSVAGCAAFFSVYGLSQLFAGASLAVIIMASTLEFSKIVAATLLHRYWSELGKLLRTYLTIGVMVLVTITSAGIYGFLSSAYQKTSTEYEIHNGGVNLISNKIKQFEFKIASNQKIIDSKDKRLTKLNDLRTNQEDRLTNSTSNSNANRVRSDISKSNIEIEKLGIDIDRLTVENGKLNDSISSYNLKKFEKEGSSKVTGEIGPLKYISEITGIEMNRVVNYMIILLIVVFDPLAIALVIGTNWVFERERRRAEEEEIDKLYEGLENSGLDKPFELIPEDTVIEPIDEDWHKFDDRVDAEEVPEPVVVEPPQPPSPPVSNLERSDIREIKEMERRKKNSLENNNRIERIGSNKIIKNNDKDNIIFRKNNG